MRTAAAESRRINMRLGLFIVLVSGAIWATIVTSYNIAEPSGILAPVGLKPTALQNTRDQLIAPIGVEWDGHGAITFLGKFLRSGEKLPVYLDWGSVAGGGDIMGGQPVLGGSFIWDQRVEIGFIDRFASGQRLKVTIGVITAMDGGQQVLQWGEEHYGNPKVGISWGSYVGKIIILGKDGTEEQYPFLIISRSVMGEKPVPPTIVSPSILGWMHE